MGDRHFHGPRPRRSAHDERPVLHDAEERSDGAEPCRPFELIGLRTGIKHTHLEAALAVYLHGTFAGAAEAIAAKPATISRHLRDLEFLLGTKIYDRPRGSRLTPTRSGVIFLRETLPLLISLQRLVASIRQMGDGKAGRIAIGYHGPLAHGALHNLLFRPDPLFQAIRLHPMEMAHDVIGASLANGYIDLGVVWGQVARPAGDVHARPLWHERVLAVLPEHHPLASHARLAWQDLADEVFLISAQNPVATIRAFLTDHLAPLHRMPKMVVQDVGATTIIHTIAAGHKIGLSLESMLGEQPAGTVYREISGATGPEYVTAFACWRDDNPNPVLARFLKRLLIRFPTVTGTVR